MSRTMAVINIFLVVADLLLSALAVCAFAWAAVYFHKWWLILFTLVPVALYSNHSIIVDSDVRRAEVDNLKPKEGEKDS